MSDHFIVLVPGDPRFPASPEVQKRVSAILRRIAPSADCIAAEVSEAIRFHHAGSNFERVGCLRCAAEISLSWWRERMKDDSADGGFRLDRYATPCCGARLALSELKYHFPQAFGRTSWTVQNANTSELADEARQELEAAAGVPLVAVYRHL